MARCSLALIIIMALLAGCSGTSSGANEQSEIGAGGVSPTDVVRNFLEDLNRALKDPQLADEDTRSAWVERLSGYFAPTQRDDQRPVISASLRNFVHGLSELQPGETATLELRFEGVRELSNDGARALVQPINGNVYLLIVGNSTYEQPVPFSQVFGREDGAMPVIRIGSRWFLTES